MIDVGINMCCSMPQDSGMLNLLVLHLRYDMLPLFIFLDIDDGGKEEAQYH